MTTHDSWMISDREMWREKPTLQETWRLRAEKLQYLPLLVGQREVGYLGWLGHANVGDEAVWEGYKLAFSQHTLTPLPRNRFLERLVNLKRRPPVETVLLGGGTLIGTAEFRRAVTLLADRGVRPFMLGPGVEDPDFPSRQAEELKAEQPNWPEVLARFDRVTVRGPRSQAILQSLGVTADVIGDPALLLGEQTPTAADPERRIGVNLGVSTGVWGDQPEQILQTVVTALNELLKEGWHVTVFPMWPRDLPYLYEAQRRLNGQVEFFTNFENLAELIPALSRCRLFVGMKLHSVVLASAVFVPSLMLEYMPKCRDFQESVGCEHRTIRTDVMTADSIVEQIHDLDENRLAERQHLETRVTELRGRLRDEAARINEQISLKRQNG